MAILPIVEVPDARLRETCAPVAEVNDEVRGIVADLFDTMYDAPGIGLAAIWGAMIGALALRSQGLLAPIVAHIAADAVIFAVLASAAA